MLADMAELVDALVSGTSGATLGSSSLLIRTTNFRYRPRSARLRKLSATRSLGEVWPVKFSGL